MELPVDNRPVMVDFTASEDIRIVSDNGAMCMNFEAGETRPVHRELFTAAVKAGLVPEGPMEAIAAPEVKPNKSTEDTIQDGLLEACKLLIARGEPTDFTQIGLPRAASVKKLVDFDFKSIDVQKAFEQAIWEIENGDNSPEHTESISSDTE